MSAKRRHPSPHLRPSGVRRSRRRHVPRVPVNAEPLERRVQFSTLVTTLSDTTDADDGVLSLREAVAQVPTFDRVFFSADLRGTIVLAGGPIQIKSAQNLDVFGPGADALAVSGGDAARVFQLAPGAKLRLSGLTITGGRAEAGAGIYSEDGSLTVAACRFENNHATGPSGNGGAIYKKGGTLTVSDTTFSANAADQTGGGIFVDSNNLPAIAPVVVTDCTFISNAATDGAAVAQPVHDGPLPPLIVAGSTFRDNHVSGHGGAIFGGGDVTTSRFVSNTADGGGGGIWQTYRGGALNIVGSTFESNRSIAGGGGAVGQMYDTGPITIFDCAFRANHARGGGAVAYGSGGRCTIVGGSFEDNEATAFGGGALSASETHFQISGSSFTNNRAATDGGAMRLFSCDLSLDGATFIGNQALGGSGGAVSISYSGPILTIGNSHFIDNSATGSAGAPGVDGGAGGNGGAAEGGALFLDLETIGTRITATDFIGNAARGGDGGSGGATGDGGKGGDASGGAIANRGGGPVAALTPGPRLDACRFINNRAIAGDGGDTGSGRAGAAGNAFGGGMLDRLEGRSDVVVAELRVLGNLAAGGAGGNASAGGAPGSGGNALGGGVYKIYPSSVSFARCTLFANAALAGPGGAAGGAVSGAGGNAFGGGLYAPARAYGDSGGELFVSASTIVRNLAVGGRGVTNGLGRGGGIYSAGQRVRVDSASRVIANRASDGSDNTFGNVLLGGPPARSPQRRGALLPVI